MSNLPNPPSIIFINSNISTNVQYQIEKQLYITETIPYSTLELRVASDGYYHQHIIGLDERLLVLANLNDYSNRAYADIVLCYVNGLVYVEKNKVSIPGKCIPLQIISIAYLLI